MDNSKRRVSNEQLLAELESLRVEMNRRFSDINPYIEFLRDANVARKIAAWMFGFLVAIGGAALLIKRLFISP